MELNQFCILARTQKGRACAALVQQVLGHKKIFVFGDLLEVPSVLALKDGEFRTAYNTLELFAHGTVKDYYHNLSNYLELTDSQLLKLRQLTLLSLCSHEKSITYDKISDCLLINKSIRDVEDLIIDSINNGLLCGKLNQNKQYFLVTSCTGRDISRADIPAIINALSLWKERCVAVSSILSSANQSVANNRALSQQEQLETQNLAEKQKLMIKQQIESGEYEESVEDFGFGSNTVKRSLRSISSIGMSAVGGAGRIGRL